MSTDLRRAFEESLAPLQAEESLGHALEFGVGSGTIEEGDRRSVVREWRARADGVAVRRSTREEALAFAAQLGVAVETPAGGAS